VSELYLLHALRQTASTNSVYFMRNVYLTGVVVTE